ncbi:fibronectin type III domain-containing protein [Pedobacter sp.]|nr:fibronectin type III domain-containing protein [Candidatus Saccharibacteria bacterium]
MSDAVYMSKDGALYPRGRNKPARPVNSGGGSGGVAIYFSTVKERTNPAVLNGNGNVNGYIAVFTLPDTNVQSVTYSFPGLANHAETNPPFDFLGGDATNQALLWDTTTLLDGAHTVTASIVYLNAVTETVTATFNTNNPSVVSHVAGAPRNAVATAGVGLVMLDWTAPADLGVPTLTGYRITSNNGYNATINNPSAVSTAISGLPTTTVTFTIRAINAGGESIATNFNAVTPDEPYVAGQQPASSSYPNAAVTGWQPTGVTLLAATSGTMSISGGNVTLDRLNHTGVIEYRGTGILTIKRSRLVNPSNWVVRRYSGYIVIEDCELDGNNKGGGGAIVYNNYTMRRCNLHHFAEGPRIAGGNVVIEDSWLHDMVQVGANHTDAIQQVSGANSRIRRNRVDCYNPVTNLVGNAGFMFGSDNGLTSDVIVEENYFNGGNYTINGGGSGTTTAQAIIRNNTFGRKFRYGIKSVPGGVTWASTNVWEDNGQPVPGGAIVSQSTWSGA